MRTLSIHEKALQPLIGSMVHKSLLSVPGKPGRDPAFDDL